MFSAKSFMLKYTIQPCSKAKNPLNDTKDKKQKKLTSTEFVSGQNVHYMCKKRQKKRNLISNQEKRLFTVKVGSY